MLLVLLFLIQPPVTFFVFKLTFVFRNQVAFSKPSAYSFYYRVVCSLVLVAMSRAAARTSKHRKKLLCLLQLLKGETK